MLLVNTNELKEVIFSIVIPTFNRPEMLALCLEKLDASVQAFNRHDYEIIVSDDGDVTNTSSTLNSRFSNVIFIQGPKKGPAANRNNGAKNAKGNWLIFLDDDCVPHNHLLNGYKEAVNNEPDIKAFEGRIYTDTHRKRLDEEAPVNESGGLFWSCNIMIEKAFFNRIKGFDEDYPYACMEDIDLREKIGKPNIRFVKNAAVLHPWRRVDSFKSLYTKKWISHKIFYSKHPHYPNFQKSRYLKTVILSTKDNVFQIFSFRFRGFRYNLSLLKFQYRFLAFLLFR